MPNQNDDSDFNRGNLGMIAFVIFIGLMLMMGCSGSDNPEDNYILMADFFAGEHQILPFEGDSECGFLSYNHKEKTYYFYWQNANNEYSSLFKAHQSQVRFEYDEAYQSPVIRIRWLDIPTNKKGQAIMPVNQWRSCVIYIVIRGKAEHLNVKLPGTI